MTKRVVLLYLLMLTCQVGHVFEEICGRLWLVNAFRSLGLFLLANWVLFCVPVAFFYFVLCERRWAYHPSMIYSGIMILNGPGHNIGTVLTGRYFDGFAGRSTGIAFVLIGPAMIYYLRKEMPGIKSNHKC
jgi:hypothetical protein